MQPNGVMESRLKTYHLLIGLPLTVALACFCGPAIAQEPGNSHANIITQPALPLPSETREAYIARVLKILRTNAASQLALTKEDVLRSRNMTAATGRATIMSAFFSQDRNGDGQLDEGERALGGNGGFTTDMRRKEDFSDPNNDGIVTMAEAFATASERARLIVERTFDTQLSNLLKLDPDGDGQLTADELETIARARFGSFDKDGDGLLNTEEQAVLKIGQQSVLNDQVRRLSFAQCVFDPPAAAERIYLISAYEAGTLSTVTVAGQDRETETAIIEIEPGTEPLYIVASSYTPMIWRVTGAVERVARFHASARGGVGVVGLPKQKVRVISDRECLPSLYQETRNGRSNLGDTGLLFDRPVAGIVPYYTVGAVKLPSQAMTPDQEQPKRGTKLPAPPLSLARLKPTDPDALNALMHFSPGGIVDLDPATVVASEKAEPYVVLPQEAGLVQLLQEGSLSRQANGVYRIDKPVARFPAGLSGAHSVRFQLGTDVPLPAGSAGHSSVIDMNGKLLSGPMGPRRK